MTLLLLSLLFFIFLLVTACIFYTGKSAYRIGSDEDQIKYELINNGPVEATFAVYEDFQYYKTGEFIMEFVLIML